MAIPLHMSLVIILDYFIPFRVVSQCRTQPIPNGHNMFTIPQRQKIFQCYLVLVHLLAMKQVIMSVILQPTLGNAISIRLIVSHLDVTLDPLGLPYNPDPTLLMAYYACASRFTTQQNQIMVGMLTGHPDWAFLNDSEVPSCQELPYDKGLVIRDCEGVKITEFQLAPAQTPMEEVILSMENSSSFSCLDLTDENGVYLTFPCLNSPPYSSADLLSLLPDVDYSSPLEGVTSYDLVQISKHILSIEPFENPFQIIAADVNNSGSITTFDIVELRKLILGIYNKLPNNSYFRYVPDYCFEDNGFYLNFYDPNNLGVNPFDAQWDNPDEPGTMAVPQKHFHLTTLGLTKSAIFVRSISLKMV